jgi:hypothetical protein
MKSIFTLFIATLIGLAISAQTPQTPQGIKYQSVVRDNSGTVVANQPVSLKLSILKGGVSGAVVYTETHSVTTNAFGLISVNIGGGTTQSGTFSAISWGSDTHFLKVEMDVSGGTTYTTFGTSQFLSVPYALCAKTVENADVDTTNEIQTLSISGTQLSLSKNGGTITLPGGGTGGGDNWGTQVAQTDATIGGDGTSATPLSLAQQGATTGQILYWNGTTWIPGTNDADDSNELQTLSVSNDTLSISGGNSVKLPADNWGTQVAQTDATLVGDGTTALPLSIAPQGAIAGQFLGWNGTSWMPANEGQTLSVTGNNLSISGGNSVALPGSAWGINGSNIYFNTGNVGIGFNTPQTYLHISDAAGMVLPQLQIDNAFAGSQGNASIGFASINTPINYTIGLDNAMAEFKISAASQLQPAAQNDGVTMYKVIPPGITSFSNQSRARVFQSAGAPPEIIPFATWQPVDFDTPTYDTHGEFTVGSVGLSGPGGPATTMFTAIEEGFYQVNARTDFQFMEDYDPSSLNINGYVCIAIYVGTGGAPGTIFSKGNKLQGSAYAMSSGEELFFALPNNLAPNVSDVIYLRPGDTIEIWVWQDIYSAMGLVPGSSETYVSIHKIS